MAPPAAPTLLSLGQAGFDFKFVSHADAILEHDFPDALGELALALSDLQLPIVEIIRSGGGETPFTQRLRRSLNQAGWHKHCFEITKTVDGIRKESTSHEIDHVRRISTTDVGVDRVLALEIEWNNKDPFFDRDLENFKRLHSEGAISVGILVTRGASLQGSMWDIVRRFAAERSITSFEDLRQVGYEPTPKQRSNVLDRTSRSRAPIPFADAWTDNFVSNKFGQATTHWAKLMDRVHRGVGNPCPLLLIGLPTSIVVP